jgi:Big-like domain-containing protein
VVSSRERVRARFASVSRGRPGTDHHQRDHGGHRDKVYVNVKNGTSPVPGTVQLRVGKGRAQQANLRSGIATFTLPRLKPGGYVVTATYPSTTGYTTVTTTKKITVKPKKKPRKR